VICKVNVDDEPALASQFGFSSIPTLVVIRNGEVAHQSSGARPKNQIIALLEG
jgi:thioredoxin 1